MNEPGTKVKERSEDQQNRPKKQLMRWEKRRVWKEEQGEGRASERKRMLLSS